MNREVPAREPEISRSYVLSLCVECETAAVSVLLSFLGFGVFTFEVSERYVQRLVSEADSNGIHRDAFLVQRVGVGLAEAVKLCAFNSSFLRNRFQLTQEVSIRVPASIWKHEIVGLGIPFSHSVLDLPNELRWDRNESVLGGLFFFLPLRRKWRHGFG